MKNTIAIIIWETASGLTYMLCACIQWVGHKVQRFAERMYSDES